MMQNDWDGMQYFFKNYFIISIIAMLKKLIHKYINMKEELWKQIIV